MILNFFDFFSRVVAFVMDTLSGLFGAALKVLSAVSGFVFAPLTWAADCLWDSRCFFLLAGAALILIVLAFIGGALLAYGHKK